MSLRHSLVTFSLLALGCFALASPALADERADVETPAPVSPVQSPAGGVAPVQQGGVAKPPEQTAAPSLPSQDPSLAPAPDSQELPAKRPVHFSFVGELGEQHDDDVGDRLVLGLMPTVRIRFFEFGALLEGSVNPFEANSGLAAGALGVSLPSESGLRFSLLGLVGRSSYSSLHGVNWEESGVDTALPWAGARAGVTYITGTKSTAQTHLQYGISVEGGSTLSHETQVDPEGQSFSVGGARFGAQLTVGLDADL